MRQRRRNRQPVTAEQVAREIPERINIQADENVPQGTMLMRSGDIWQVIPVELSSFNNYMEYLRSEIYMAPGSLSTSPWVRIVTG